MLNPNLDFINVKERTLKLTVGGRGEWGGSFCSSMFSVCHEFWIRCHIQRIATFTFSLFLNVPCVRLYTLFFIRTSNILPSFNVLIFPSIWASSVLISVLIHSCSDKLQFIYLTITSHLACWKSQKFPISEGKKDF